MLTKHPQEVSGFVKPVRAIVTVRVSINNGATIFEQNIGLEPLPLVGGQMLCQLSYILRFALPDFV